MAWSQGNIVRLLDAFVPCADEVWRLQNAEGCESDVFRGFCDDGHYAARKGNGSTRQGIFVVTPKGDLLRSWNVRRPEVVERNLRAALADWKKLSKEERLPSGELFEGVRRAEDAYPEGGLALRVFTRDLPREDAALAPDDWRVRAWNIDHLWFSAAEARALVAGALDENAARRLVRLHARDNARGQTNGYPGTCVRNARLDARVVEREGDTVELELTGVADVHEKGRWRIDDHAAPREQERSFRGTLYGRATWNGTRFTAFRLAMAGMRVGATRYNERTDDLGPAPLAVVFELAPESDRVAPSMFWTYGWPIPEPPAVDEKEAPAPRESSVR